LGLDGLEESQSQQETRKEKHACGLDPQLNTR
jgi:hypothetical protein